MRAPAQLQLLALQGLDLMASSLSGKFLLVYDTAVIDVVARDDLCVSIAQC